MTAAESTLTRPDERLAEPGDHDRFAHYFRKTDIEKAYLDGAAIQALCGKVDVPLRDPQRYPVCPDCKRIYEEVLLP